MSSHVYEIMKTIYSTPASESTDATRISILQNTLSQLRLSNIATLDGLMTHFTRLIELTSADEAYVSALATTLAPCILRPKVETSMTMEEKYSYRLIRDLFAHKQAIFSELKRASSLTHTPSIDTQRPRAISTDESNRKANMEARARAVIAASGAPRSRATSPAPSPRGHRRDRSSGGPETRFPIQTSPTSPDQVRARAPARQSLEVPKDSDAVPASAPEAAPTNGASVTVPLASITNGSTAATNEAVPQTSATYIPGMGDGMDDILGGAVSGVAKRDSLGRSGHVANNRFSLGGRRPVGGKRMSIDQGGEKKRDSLVSLGGHEGVTLTDKPMDD